MKQKVKESSVSKLMPSLANKLAIAAASGTDKQCQIRKSDLYAESQIGVLSLQVITQSAVRFAADNLRSENLVKSVSQKSTSSSSLMNKKKLHAVIFKKKPILELIQNTQELDMQCRHIVGQLCGRMQYDLLLALILQSLLQHYTVTENNLLLCVNCVLVSLNEAICSQLLQIFHDCSSDDH